MNELKRKILEILDEKFLNHKGINKLAEILCKIIGSDYEQTLQALVELEQEGEIFEFVKHKYASSKNLGLVKGKLSINNGNFGFVSTGVGKDIFVAKRNLLKSFDGDTVLVKILSGEYQGKNPEGKVVKILLHNSTGIVGTFSLFRGYGYVEPDKSEMQIKVPLASSMGAKDGDKVVVDIVSIKSGVPVGKITEVIGNLNEKGNDVKWLLRQYKVRDTFPQNVVDCAKRVPQEVDIKNYPQRRDLTGELLFTIDGKDAKDLDDAVSLKKNDDGTYLLGVHIADVGEYVRLDSTLDKEAYTRGTSIYFLDYVIPMLPKELSNGICSLNEGVPRLALSVLMTIDKEGNVTNSEIFESVIKSKHRLNYDEVLEVLEGNKKTQKRLSDVTPMLLDMLELSNILDARRKKFGSLDFDLPEGEVLTDENGKPTQIIKRKSTKSTKIIETFMVVANEVVAKTFDKLKIPFVYRVHEKPDSEKMQSFYNFINTFGISHKGDNKEVEPKDLQEILNSIKGQDAEEVVNMIMLRSLKKAKYFEKCLGHFGMALTYYCHFTSPIRRYPDLTIHRIIKEYLHGNNAFLSSPKMQDFVIKASVQSSNQEKLSEDVERAITDYKKCEYMSGFVGETFDGIISGVTQRGFFVELDNTCEGLVPVSSLKNGFYEFDEKTLSLVSSVGRFRIGEKVEVRVASCNLPDRKINFEFVKKLNSTKSRA